MNLVDFIVEQRDKQVLSHVRAGLRPGEEVIGWARTRATEGRRQGYCYLTPQRIITAWPTRPQHDGDVALEDVECWGVDADVEGGPLLRVEGNGTTIDVQLQVGGNATARRVSYLLHSLAHHAPAPRRDFDTDGVRTYVSKPVTVQPRRRSAGGHTRRILVTMLGLLLIAGGAAIAWIPGPWSLPIVIAGLAILASEYDWAQDVLDWAKEVSRRAKQKISARRADKRT